MKRILMLALLAAFAGCSKQEDQAAAPTPAPGTPTAGGAAPVTADPGEILAEVDGTTLTRGQADEELGYRMASTQNRIPPERMEEYRARMFNNVVDQFVMRTVLLNEANRLNIAVTPEDEAEALEKIRETLPPDLTPEEVMKNSPMGEERMKNEMLVGIRINKLLEQQLNVDSAVDEKAVDAFIEENRQRLEVPESVAARHILISADASDDEAAKAAKKQKIEDLHKQLLDGADFAELAKNNSTCPSASRGGDLGSFSKGRMVPEFENAAFAQEKDAIGNIVETKFGYHIIQVTEKIPAGLMDREKITQIVKNRNYQELMTTYIDGLKAKAEVKDHRAPAPSM